MLSTRFSLTNQNVHFAFFCTRFTFYCTVVESSRIYHGMHITPELLKSRVKLVDVAVMAYDLGLWPDAADHVQESALKAALRHSPLDFVRAWQACSQTSFPAGLDEHVHTRFSANSRLQSPTWVARFVTKVFHNQLYLYERGLAAYTDVCRRLEAVVLTVLPSETEAVHAADSFATNLQHVNRFRHEEDFVVSAATVLVSTLLVRESGRSRVKLVGALTIAPVDWKAVPVVDTQVCESDMGAPHAKYLALLANNTVVYIDTDSGAYSATALDVHDNESLLWISVANGHVFSGSRASLYEFTGTGTDRLVLSPLPSSNRMDKSAPSISFPVPGSARVLTLCLSSKQVSVDAGEADTMRAELHDAAGAYRNHVYRNGQVLVSLPSGERIVAVHAWEHVVDVFTETNDWWRIDVDTKRAVVVGLDLSASVKDIAYLDPRDGDVEDVMDRLAQVCV